MWRVITSSVFRSLDAPKAYNWASRKSSGCSCLVFNSTINGLSSTLPAKSALPIKIVATFLSTTSPFFKPLPSATIVNPKLYSDFVSDKFLYGFNCSINSLYFLNNFSLVSVSSCSSTSSLNSLTLLSSVKLLFFTNNDCE